MTCPTFPIRADDERFDPKKTGYAPDVDNEDNPQRNLWRLLLDLDGDGSVSASENIEITRGLVIDRIFDNDPNTRLLPDPLTANFGQFDLLSLNQITTVFAQEFLIAAQALLGDDAAAEALTNGLPFWGPIETQMKGIRDRILAGIDDPDECALYLEGFRVNLNAARVSAAFSAQIASSTFSGYTDAAVKLAEVFDPKLRITGQLSPTFLGFPMGPPSQSVDVTLSKKELSVRGEFSTLAQAFNLVFLPALVNDRTQIEAHFPFENLLEDLYLAQVPRIDPLADDWRVGIGTSMNVFGLQISNTEGILFPAGADGYLLGDAEQPGKIQLFYGPEHLESDDPAIRALYDTSPDPLDPNKILVRASEHDDDLDFISRLLDQGGVLVDGRLALPRFLTDPLAFWDDLQNDPDLQKQLSDFRCDDTGLYECITSHPVETFALLGTVPSILSEAVTLEEVAQLQMFVPNFIDDVIESLDGPTRAQLDQLINDPNSSSETIANFITQQVGNAFSAAGSALQDAYLIGTWGQLAEPYADQPFNSSLPPYDEQGDPLANYELTFDVEEGFDAGDDLAAVNSRVANLGVSFTSAADETYDTLKQDPRLGVITDPDDDSNGLLNVASAVNGADLLLNFDSPISVAAVTFAYPSGDPPIVTLIAYDKSGTAIDIEGLDAIETVSGKGKQTFVIRQPGIRACRSNRIAPSCSSTRSRSIRPAIPRRRNCWASTLAERRSAAALPMMGSTSRWSVPSWDWPTRGSN